MSQTMARSKTLSDAEAKLKKKEYDKKRREKMKSDSANLKNLREKERVKYLKKKQKGQVKSIATMSPREKWLTRKNWEKNSQNYRARKSKTHIIISKPLDGQDICLTCLQQNSAMVSISQVFSDPKTVTIADVLNELNCLNIADVENATKQICIDCFNKLKFCYNFQQQCRKSESIWKGSTTYNENADTNSSNEWTVSLVDPAKATQSENVSIVKTEMKTEPEDGCTESVMEFEEIQIKEEPLVCNNEEPSNLSPANIKEAVIDESPQHLQTKTNSEDSVLLLCLLCKLSFDKRTNFWSHTKTVHIDDCALQMIPTCETINDFKFCYITSYCRKCNLHFISEDIFLSHLKTHPESSENVCSLCKAVFGDSQKYYLHVKRHFVPLEKYLHLPPQS